MWIPSCEQDIKDAIASGTLRETSTFDAKAALPSPGRNKDLAKDICAMTADGGLLLYGVGGDDPTRPDRPMPFDLVGAAERLDQVAQTSISEPPHIEIHDIVSDDQPGTGYLAVLVPASPRAPHMLIVDGDNRYWGRGATGNRILTQGEVARLYAQREAWDVDRGSWLAERVAAAPFAFEDPIDKVGLMLTIIRPVAAPTEFVRRLAAPAELDRFLQDNLARIGNEQDPYPSQGTSGLGQAFALTRQGSDRWTISYDRELNSRYQARVELDPDGEVAYWHSPVVSAGNGTVMFLMEQSVTRAVHQGVAAARFLLETAGFVGAVDIGVAVLGIAEAHGASFQRPFADAPGFGAFSYARDERVTMSELRVDLPAVVRRLLAPLFDVISVRDYDPYDNARDLPA